LLAIDFARDSNIYFALRAAFALAAAVPMSGFFRTCATLRRELNRQMRSFTFSEARSFSEEDRTMLHHIISSTYRCGAGGDDGIARFEQQMRSRMPAVGTVCWGRPW
jgi:hypothetical protein